MNVEVVLLEDDPKLGKRGDVVKVSSGFAQNFLYPHNKAKAATPANLRAFEAEKAKHAKDEAERLAAARQTAARLKEFTLAIEVSAGEGDKLYGAVNSQDIVQALAAHGIRLERKEIHLDEPLKKLGSYEVSVKPHPQVQAALKLTLVKK